MSVLVANCPSCGAPVEFKSGQSIVVICGILPLGDRAHRSRVERSRQGRGACRNRIAAGRRPARQMERHAV